MDVEKVSDLSNQVFFALCVNPSDATILKRWRGEELPSVYGGEDVNL